MQFIIFRLKFKQEMALSEKHGKFPKKNSFYFILG
jgi:hypothetical protein